jgi:hypothetical protein
LPVDRGARRPDSVCTALDFLVQCASGLAAPPGKAGVAVLSWLLRSLSAGCLVAVLAAALAAAPASALSIVALTPAKGGTNTADGTTTTGQNFSQTTSSVSTTLSPTTVPDTLGSVSEFITRYAMIVAADRQMTSGNFTLTMTSSYSITFTVNNPTGATVRSTSTRCA